MALVAVQIGWIGSPAQMLPTGPVAGPAATALADLAGGEARAIGDGVELTVVASFFVPGHGYCREFELFSANRPTMEFGLACRASGGWTVAVVGSEPVAEGSNDPIRPAAGGADDPIGGFLDRAGAGPALSAEEERAARRSGWRE